MKITKLLCNPFGNPRTMGSSPMFPRILMKTPWYLPCSLSFQALQAYLGVMACHGQSNSHYSVIFSRFMFLSPAVAGPPEALQIASSKDIAPLRKHHHFGIFEHGWRRHQISMNISKNINIIYIYPWKKVEWLGCIKSYQVFEFCQEAYVGRLSQEHPEPDPFLEAPGCWHTGISMLATAGWVRILKSNGLHFK